MPRTKTSTKKKTTKKAPKKKVEKEEIEKKAIKKVSKYFGGLGRRKTSTARVRLSVREEKTPQESKLPTGQVFLVNDKPLEKYFPTLELQKTALSPFEKMNCLDQFGVLVRVKGGGLNSQAEAVRHGIAKALVVFNPDSRKKLKQAGLLTRDSRMRERKKFGLKRARRAPQWQKR